MQIPWAEPVLDEREIEAVVETMRSGWVGMGPRVKQFEARLAEYVGVPHAIAVNTDNAALDTCLKALGVGRDDEVILPAMSYINGAFAVTYQAARPVLADIDPRTFCIDPSDVERRITPRTRAIVAIDYGGQVADWDALGQIARRHGLRLVENSAGSLGGSWRGKMAGSFGDLAMTDFHAAKLMTTVEGGMIFTADADLAARCRMVRGQGEDPTQKYRHSMIGNNYRMTDILAAIGLVQLDRLPDLLARRTRLCKRYNRHLADLRDLVELPYLAPERVHGWFFYSILVDRRDEVERRLKERGVDTRVAWRVPVYRQPVYAASFPGDTYYAVAEHVAARVLNLPLFAAMTDEQQNYVVEALHDAVTATASAAAGR